MRLRAIGISQRELAEMLGVSINTVSRQFRGEWAMPGYVGAFMTALEMMDSQQRSLLMERLRPFADHRPE